MQLHHIHPPPPEGPRKSTIRTATGLIHVNPYTRNRLARIARTLRLFRRIMGRSFSRSDLQQLAAERFGPKHQ